jgi:hypothetical protein
MYCTVNIMGKLFNIADIPRISLVIFFILIISLLPEDFPLIPTTILQALQTILLILFPGDLLPDDPYYPPLFPDDPYDPPPL